MKYTLLYKIFNAYDKEFFEYINKFKLTIDKLTAIPYEFQLGVALSYLSTKKISISIIDNTAHIHYMDNKGHTRIVQDGDRSKTMIDAYILGIGLASKANYIPF